MKDATKQLMLIGVEQAGTYDPDEVLIYIEEHLNGRQTTEIKNFLGWVHGNKLEFGPKNVNALLREFEGRHPRHQKT